MVRLVKSLFWFADCWLLLVSSHGVEQREEASALVTLIRALILFMRAPLSYSPNPNYLPKTSPPNTITSGEGWSFNIWIWGGGTQIFSLQQLLSSLFSRHTFTYTHLHKNACIHFWLITSFFLVRISWLFLHVMKDSSETSFSNAAWYSITWFYFI